MSLTNLHPSNMSLGQFQVMLKSFLTEFEGSKSAPYFDTNASPKPTIGIGFNLRDSTVRNKVFAAMNLTQAQKIAAGKVLANTTIKTDTDLQSKLKTAIGRDFVMTDNQISMVFNLEAKDRIAKVKASS